MALGTENSTDSTARLREAMSDSDGPILSYRITAHARFEMDRRQITEEDVASVLANPQSIEVVRTGRRVYQSFIAIGALQREYLLRVIVDVDESPNAVATAYRTSKIAKYRSTEA
jgi:hypothetical protein